MGHFIELFVSKPHACSALAGSIPGSRVVRLATPWAGLVPLSAEPAETVAFPQFEYLAPEWASAAAEASRDAPIAYVETQYHGGHGGQAAIVWEAGKVVLGPTDNYAEPTDPWPINSALRRLGVSARDRSDEFLALGLGMARCSEDFTDWL